MIPMNRVKALIAMLVIIAWLVPSRVHGQDETNYNVNRQGVMIDGYDVVSYFIGAVAKGKANISVQHNGVEYWFENQENKEIFIKNPDKFIPAYGGWCAYAMAEPGEKVKIDPETFKLVNGRLYLFYNFYFNNTLIDWNEDEQNLLKKADANWQRIIE